MVKKYTFNHESTKQNENPHKKPIVAVAHILRLLLMNGYESYKFARLAKSCL